MAAISTCISSKMSMFQYFQLSFLFGTYKKKTKRKKYFCSILILVYIILLMKSNVMTLEGNTVSLKKIPKCSLNVEISLEKRQ